MVAADEDGIEKRDQEFRGVALGRVFEPGDAQGPVLAVGFLPVFNDQGADDRRRRSQRSPGIPDAAMAKFERLNEHKGWGCGCINVQYSETCDSAPVAVT